MKALRIGCVKYLNARPLIRGWPGDVVLDHPSLLCRHLAEGRLDVALVSSFEFLRNPVYKIIDQVSISSNGPVYSVIVASTDDRPAREIEMDSASETSVALLRCLMSERGTPFQPLAIAGDLLSPLEKHCPRLLIGDHAIQFRQKFGDRYRYLDLGNEWKQATSLPFVFALWLVRPEIGNAKSIADQLRALRDQNLANLGSLIADEKGLDQAFCDRYYREHLRFNFGEREKQGLRAFHQLCTKHDLLPKREIAFSVV